MLKLHLSSKIFLLSFAFLLINYNELSAQNCQNFESIEKFQSDSTLSIEDIEFDNNGNQYLFGSYIGADSIGGFPLAKMPNQTYAFFLAKRNANGQFDWVKSITRHPSGMSNFFKGIEVGPQNEIYYFASIAGFIRFDGVLFENPDSSQLQSIIIKLNSDGVIQSSVMFKSKQSPGNIFDNSVSINDLKIFNGNLYALGYFEDGMQVGNISLKANDYTRNNNLYYGTNTFVAKLSSNLNVDWVTQVKNGRQRPSYLAVNSGGIYFTSYISLSDGDSTRFGNQLISIGNKEKTTISRVNDQGQFEWTKLIPISFGTVFPRLVCNNISTNVSIMFDADTVRVNNVLRGTATKTAIHLVEFDTNGNFLKHFMVPSFAQNYLFAKDDQNNHYIVVQASNIKLYFIKIDSNFNVDWSNGNSYPTNSAFYTSNLLSVKIKNSIIYTVGQIGAFKANFGKFSINANTGTKAAIIARLEELPLSIADMNNVTIKKNEQLNIEPIITGYSKVRWTPKAGLNTDTLANVIASPQQTTTYQLKAFNACGDSVTKSITITVDGLSAIENQSIQFVIFPNPSKSSIVIEHTYNEVQVLNIYNMLGQHIQSFQVQEPKQEIKHHLLPGVYVLELNGYRTKLRVE